MSSRQRFAGILAENTLVVSSCVSCGQDYIATEDQRSRQGRTQCDSCRGRETSRPVGVDEILTAMLELRSVSREDAAALRRAIPPVERPRKGKCVHGHVIAEVGRYSNGACRGCGRESSLTHYHATKQPRTRGYGSRPATATSPVRKRKD